MRKIAIIISVCFRKVCFALLAMTFAMTSQAQTTYNFSFTTLSGSYQRNGVGNDEWNEQTVGAGQAVSGYHAPTVKYRRFTVAEIIDASGNPYWSRFDSKINAAIEAHQRFAFGVFTMYAWPEADEFFNITPTMSGTDQRTGTVRSARSAVPLAWHNGMQAGAVKNWVGESGDWVPNYNSSALINGVVTMNQHIANHLDTGSYKPTWSATPIPYKNVIQYIDIRPLGTWGEWHSYGSAPGNNVQNYPNYSTALLPDQPSTSTFPTIATFKALIDAHTAAYNPYQLVIIINAYDGMRLGNTRIPVEVGVYAMQQTTAKGFIGRRIDHAGEVTGYDDFYLQLNPNSFGGYRMDTANQYRHRLAPFVGEPPGGPVYFNGVVQGALPGQARKWKFASIGNGNYGQGNTPTGPGGDSVRLAFDLMGYHLRLTGGSAVVGSQFTVNLRWRNYGLTPTYDHYDVIYSLRNGSGTTVWSDTSDFDPYLFAAEENEQLKTDVFPLPGIAAGNYSLWVTVKDALQYMPPLQLQITGREEPSGSYFLSNISLTSSTNNRPIVDAGPNQTITLPDSDAQLNSTVSDPDGSIATILWTQTSGPNTATITTNNIDDPIVSGLIAGTYTFNMLVTDDDGDTQSDNVIITVNAAPNLAPVANAGPNLTTTLPTDSVTINGLATDDVAVSSITWTQISGPSAATIVSATNDTTKIKDLVAGVYTFRITVSDGSLTNTDDVTVTVNAAPPPPGQRRKWVWSRKPPTP